MYARRASKFKQAAPPPVGQLLFQDIYGNQPDDTPLNSLTPSVRGQGYSTLSNSTNGLGLQTYSGGGYAICELTTNQYRGNIAIPDPSYEWGTGYFAVTARMWTSPSAGDGSQGLFTCRSDDENISILNKNGLRVSLVNDTSSNEHLLTCRSYIDGSRVWHIGNLTIPADGQFKWLRLESRIDGVNTARLACSYYVGSNYPATPNDWITYVPPTDAVPIKNDANDNMQIAAATVDAVSNLRIYELIVDTYSELGV